MWWNPGVRVPTEAEDTDEVLRDATEDSTKHPVGCVGEALLGLWIRREIDGEAKAGSRDWAHFGRDLGLELIRFPLTISHCAQEEVYSALYAFGLPRVDFPAGGLCSAEVAACRQEGCPRCGDGLCGTLGAQPARSEVRAAGRFPAFQLLPRQTTQRYR